jgi:hypothetical protein
MREATGNEILRILREQSTELPNKIHVPAAQFSMPVDGKGARIRVSVRVGESAGIAESFVCPLDGEDLVVRVEVVEDYQEYKPL